MKHWIFSFTSCSLKPCCQAKRGTKFLLLGGGLEVQAPHSSSDTLVGGVLVASGWAKSRLPVWLPPISHSGTWRDTLYGWASVVAQAAHSAPTSIILLGRQEALPSAGWSGHPRFSLSFCWHFGEVGALCSYQTFVDKVRDSAFIFPWCSNWVGCVLSKNFCLAKLPLFWFYGEQKQAFRGDIFVCAYWHFQVTGFSKSCLGFWDRKGNSENLPVCLQGSQADLKSSPYLLVLCMVFRVFSCTQ